VHSKELNITTESISVERKTGESPAVIINNITSDITHEMTVIHLASALEIGSYVLSFPEYNGTIREEGYGLFRRTYTEKNATR